MSYIYVDTHIVKVLSTVLLHFEYYIYFSFILIEAMT